MNSNSNSNSDLESRQVVLERQTWLLRLSIRQRRMMWLSPRMFPSGQSVEPQKLPMLILVSRTESTGAHTLSPIQIGGSFVVSTRKWQLTPHKVHRRCALVDSRLLSRPATLVGSTRFKPLASHTYDVPEAHLHHRYLLQYHCVASTYLSDISRCSESI